MSRAALVLAALLLAAPAARAQCHRPTDPAGYNGYSYGVNPPAHLDGAKVRVWYTTSGPHAVDPASTRMDKVPDNVATAAKVGDAALASYAQMGFLAPVSDGTCGGDGRLDIYLMHFNAADGDVAPGACGGAGAATRCAVFAQVEARMELIYGSFELGAHVVIAHEMFHAVQQAYDAAMDRFWSEGTAQWAAKLLDPSETDFEAQLPAFFAAAGRSIDNPPGGAAAGYVYGAAIWPLFLGRHVAPEIVRQSFEQESMLGPPAMDAIAAALSARGTSIAAEYPIFAAWNAATGARAGTGGYPDAKSYPAVKSLTPLAAAGASEILSGYSVFFYSFDFGTAARQLLVDGDPARLQARSFPLAAGVARLDQLAALPSTVTGPGVLVVAGVSGKKSDAPFTIRVVAPAAPDAGSAPAPDGGADLASGGSAGGGCALGGPPRAPGRFALLLLLAAPLLRSGARRRAGRRRRTPGNARSRPR